VVDLQSMTFYYTTDLNMVQVLPINRKTHKNLFNVVIIIIIINTVTSGF